MYSSEFWIYNFSLSLSFVIHTAYSNLHLEIV